VLAPANRTARSLNTKFKTKIRMSKVTEEIVLYDGATQLREIVVFTATVIHSYFIRLC